MAIPEWIGNLRKKIGHDLIMVPTVAGIIANDEGALLLQLRSDNGKWTLPGGALDPGEIPATGVVREVYEETGLQVVPQRIVGIYGGPEYIFAYPNGDEVAIVNITFACEMVGGHLRVDDDETVDLQYFMPDALPAGLDNRHRERVGHYLARSGPPFKKSTFQP